MGHGVGALFGLTFFGQQMHLMTIFGMIIAVGLLIDNAIVMTDEVRKQLRTGKVRADAMHSAARHLFTPLLASTLTTILGFMPIFLLPGNVGDFAGPIAISVVLALIGSFLISMTLIAALAARFAGAADGSTVPRWWRDGVRSRAATQRYRRSLLSAVRRPWLTLAATLLPSLLGFALETMLGNQFFPPGRIAISSKSRCGCPMAARLRARRVSRLLSNTLFGVSRRRAASTGWWAAFFLPCTTTS